MSNPDYIYDPDNWEITYEWGMREELVEDDRALNGPGDIKKFCTLVNGPPKWAAHVVVTYDEAGYPDETAVRWFDTEAEARAACKTPAYTEG